VSDLSVPDQDALARLVASVDRAGAGQGLPPDVDAEVDLVHVVAMRSGARWFGFPAHSVREIVTKELVTRVPALPAHVLGVALVHGRLVPVIDLPSLVGQTGAGPPMEIAPRLVVVHEGDVEVAVVADEARGVLALPREAAPQDRTEAREFVVGEARWDDTLVCLLDGPGFIAAAVAEAIA
jgi:chemotaxis signal transduction protein